MQVRVRKPCEDCGGQAVVLDPHWRAYYADEDQQLRETDAMLAAPYRDKLDARLAVFHLWWAERLGCVEEFAATGRVPEPPAEEIPCGSCVDGWVERWVPVDELAGIAA